MGRIYSMSVSGMRMGRWVEYTAYTAQDVNISCCGQDLCNGPPGQASSSFGPGKRAAAAPGTAANYLWVGLATTIIMVL